MSNTKLDLDYYGIGDKLFIKNRTKTDFNMHLSDSHGKVTLLTIPRSFIPIEITAWASISQLKEAQEFRMAIRGQVIEIIPEDEARLLIDTPEGKIEYERLRSRLNIVDKDLLASVDDELESALSAASIGDMDNINDQLRSTLTSELSPLEKFAEVVSLDKEGSLTLDDFQFIKSTASKDCTELLKYAEDKIKELTGLLS